MPSPQDRMRHGQIALEPSRGIFPGGALCRERESVCMCVCVEGSRVVEFTNLGMILDHG